MGERIIASGQFLIDSEASLSGIEARPIGGGAASATIAAPASKATLYETTGKIERITMKAVSPLADFSYDYHDLEFRPQP